MIKKGSGKNNKNEDRFLCTKHGDEPLAKHNFYQSSNKMYEAIGILPVCKDCIAKDYEDLLSKYNDEKMATYKLCEMYNIPFYLNVYDGAYKVATQRGWKSYQSYMTQLNSFGGTNGYGNIFTDGEMIYLNNENKNSVINTESENINFENIETPVELTEQDIQVKNDVIRLIGYDPFAGYSKFDQKFLYNELISYLDEDTLDDNFKLSQILQLINNNNQIRKLDLVINSISSNSSSLITKHGDIKSLTAIKNQIVASTDKIAKENSISVKNRGDKTAGKSTLTYMMKNYRELGFEEAEQDYYDQKKAYGMRLVADISNKSIIDQLQFDENDMNDIFFTQRQLLQELQIKVSDLEEENRQLNEKISLSSLVKS